MKTPVWVVEKVMPQPDYTLLLTFADGEQKRYDARPLLEKAIYAPLRSLPFFLTARADCGTVVWNDDVDIAVESGADGVHVGQEDLEASLARERLGPGKIIGVSAHNAAEARRAEAAGADYIGSGAAFATSTKETAAPIGPEGLRAVVEAVSIPVVAIGGISRENIGRLEGLGLAGIAVVSALFAAPDVEAAARELSELAGRL